jgi:hypothetical protein
MATLHSWSSVGIGDLEVFLPSPPCLVVYTSYVDDQPESSVTYFWQDEKTGTVHHQLVYLEPVPFDTALAWAQDHAPTRGVERIHVKHARAKPTLAGKAARKTAPKRTAAKTTAAKAKPAKKAAPRKAAPKASRAPAKKRAAKK